MTCGRELAPRDASEAGRGPILRAAIGLGLYAGAFGASFGAVSVGSGLSVAQTMLLSLVMFSGASQFAFVGVVAAAAPARRDPGGPAARRPQRVLRRTAVGDPESRAGWRRLWTAHFVIDETTAMAVGQPTPAGPAVRLLGHRV